MSDERNNGPRPDDDEPLEFLNREDDPDVDFDERDDFETTPSMEPLDDDDLEDFDPDEEFDAPEPPAAEKPVRKPDPVTAAAAAVSVAAASTSDDDDDDDGDDGDDEPAPPRTARRRNGGGRKGPPVIMLAALGLILIVAAFVLWPRGSGLSDDGEGQASVLTLPDTTAVEHAAAATPRSSDVDLDHELSDVVPEESTGAEAAATRADLLNEAASRSSGGRELAEPEVATASGTAPRRTNDTPTASTPTPSTTAPAASSSTVAGDTPGRDGAWAVQIGSFGDAANADRLAGELRAKGHRVVIQDLSSGTGTVHRVWVGYFGTRAAAETYARANSKDLGAKPYITHR